MPPASPLSRIRHQQVTNEGAALPATVREAQELSSSPSPDYTAVPLESDLFEWHFTMRGPPNSAYAEGIYHGRIVLPPSYPLRPPSFRFTTPSGRFEANREICLSISGHHEETWQPAWGLRTAIVALRSFMETDPKGRLGGLATSDAVRRKLAAESPTFRCPGCGGRTNADIMKECEEAARAAAEKNGNAAGSSSKEVDVPAELTMGFRDEMEKKAAAASPGADAESAQLAEGFVQTIPRTEASSQGDIAMPAAPLPNPTPSQAESRPARPGQTVPQPTRTIPATPAVGGANLTRRGANLAAQVRVQQEQQAPIGLTRTTPPPMVRLHPDEGVPAWVDRAIAIISILLVVAVVKYVARFL